MLAFVAKNKRDYVSDIITEVKSIDEVYSITVNFVFFHKNSFQNELLRLQRHNRFCVELMQQIKELRNRRTEDGSARRVPRCTHISVKRAAPGVREHRRDGAAGPTGQSTPFSLTLGGSPALRRRTDSRAAVMEAPDFQDVYGKRSENTVARLASIRQGSRERSSSRATATGAGLDRIESRGSGSRASESRRRIWARPRSGSNAAVSSVNMV